MPLTDKPQTLQKWWARHRRVLIFGGKLLISATALYLVFRKIDTRQMLQLLTKVRVGYFVLALLAFNASKLVAALRFWYLLRPLGIQLGHLHNFRLLYIGMFYNLFLPGSIGGDGYKVYLLRQQYPATTRSLVSVALLDRLGGLLWLAMLTVLLVPLSSLPPMPYGWLSVGLVAGLMGLVFFVLVRLVFSGFRQVLWAVHWTSLSVQVGQLLCAWCLLLALSVGQPYADYLVLFMASSVVAVLPFTVGGVGARELVFLYGYQYLDIDKETAISFTVLFFAQTALSSLAGGFMPGQKARAA